MNNYIVELHFDPDQYRVDPRETKFFAWNEKEKLFETDQVFLCGRTKKVTNLSPADVKAILLWKKENIRGLTIDVFQGKRQLTEEKIEKIAA